MNVIDPTNLDEFRKIFLNSDFLLKELSTRSHLVVSLPVGVGKSCCQDTIIQLAIDQNEYDLVLSLSPTRNIINEREAVKSPIEGIKIINLEPRPRLKCGIDNDRWWASHEVNHRGILGKHEICSACEHYSTCFWPYQYGINLQGCGLIFATQTHLERDSFFLLKLLQSTGATKILILMDESNCIMKPSRRKLSPDVLEDFVDTLQNVTSRKHERVIETLKNYLNSLLRAKTYDLSNLPGWDFPHIPSDLALSLQETGVALHGDDYYYNPTYDLVTLGNSEPSSREKTPDGTICYTARHQIPGHLIIFSGTSNIELLKYRLQLPNLYNPLQDYQFYHPDTRWYNIATTHGALSNFERNSPQLLDMSINLIIKRLDERKRVLLVSKKKFKYFCADYINEELQRLQISARVVADVTEANQLYDPEVTIIPLIRECSKFCVSF